MCISRTRCRAARPRRPSRHPSTPGRKKSRSSRCRRRRPSRTWSSAEPAGCQPARSDRHLASDEGRRRHRRRRGGHLMPGPVRDAATPTSRWRRCCCGRCCSPAARSRPATSPAGRCALTCVVETLADAVSKGGGIGIARMLRIRCRTRWTSWTSWTPAARRRPKPKIPAPHAPVSAGPGPSAFKSGALPAVLDVPTAAVTSPFGRRPDPIDGGSKYHTGIDLRAPEGSPIKVAADGIVKNAGQRGGYGNAVEIDHGGGLTTLYAHASELLVTEGEKVPGRSGHRPGRHDRTCDRPPPAFRGQTERSAHRSDTRS